MILAKIAREKTDTLHWMQKTEKDAVEFENKRRSVELLDRYLVTEIPTTLSLIENKIKEKIDRGETTCNHSFPDTVEGSALLQEIKKRMIGFGYTCEYRFYSEAEVENVLEPAIYILSIHW